MPLPVSIRDSGDITIIDIQGRATISDAESELLRKKLTELIANGKRKCEFNLAGLSHLDKFRLSVIVKSVSRCAIMASTCGSYERVAAR